MKSRSWSKKLTFSTLACAQWLGLETATWHRFLHGEEDCVHAAHMIGLSWTRCLWKLARGTLFPINGPYACCSAPGHRKCGSRRACSASHTSSCFPCLKVKLRSKETCPSLQCLVSCCCSTVDMCPKPSLRRKAQKAPRTGLHQRRACVCHDVLKAWNVGLRWQCLAGTGGESSHA